MSTFTALIFGFPLRGQYPFTTVVDGSVHHGMVQNWQDLIAADHDLPVVGEPIQEQLYGPGDSDDDVVGDAERTRIEEAYCQYCTRVQQLIVEMGCSLYAAGSGDFVPDFFVAALCPRLESEPERSPFKPLPELAVGPEVHERLQRFCAVLGVPYEEPRWYLVDSYSMD